MGSPGFDVRKDYYRILGVSPDQTDFKTAFFKLAKACHPDKGGDPERFKEVREAYEVLTDPDLKEAYDRARLLSGFASSGGTSSAPPPRRPRQQPHASASTKHRPRPSASTKPRPASGNASPKPKPKPSKYSYYESEDESDDTQEASDSDSAIPQSSLPPDFRQRKPAPYGSTPQQHKQSQRPQRPKAAPRQTMPSHDTPPHKDPDDCVFSDYYLPSYRETPFLQRLRANYDNARHAWRNAADEVLDAKHTMDHCLMGSYAALLDWERKEAIASDLRRKKWVAERVKNGHVRRARELKRRRKAAEAKVSSTDQYEKRAGAKRKREAEAGFGMGEDGGFW